MTTAKTLELDQFRGAEERTRYSPLFPMLLTEGTLYLAEQAGAYWLMDAISSWQPEALKNEYLREIQFWTLKVDRERRSAVLICQIDSNIEPSITQQIEYTDFPLPEIKLWVSPYDERHYQIFLPSEY